MTALPSAALFAICLLLYLALPGAWWLAGLPFVARWPRAVMVRGLMVASLILPLGNTVAWGIGRLAGAEVQPVAVNESVMALVVLFWPAVVLMAEEPSHLGRVWCVVCAVALITSAYMTGVIAWCLSAAGWMLWRWKTRPMRLGGIAVVAASLSVMLGWAGMTPGLLGPRAEIWAVGWRMFAAAPLTGQGVGSFADHWSAMYPDAPPYTHAHNLPLHVLAETGLLGLGALIALVWVVVRRLWRRRAEPWTQGALCSLLAFGALGLADNPLSIGPVAVLMALIVLSV